MGGAGGWPRPISDLIAPLPPPPSFPRCGYFAPQAVAAAAGSARSAAAAEEDSTAAVTGAAGAETGAVSAGGEAATEAVSGRERWIPGKMADGGTVLSCSEMRSL